MDAQSFFSRIKTPSQEDLERVAQAAQKKLLDEQVGTVLRSPEALDVSLSDLLASVPALGMRTLGEIVVMLKPDTSCRSGERSARLTHDQVESVKSQLAAIFAEGYKGSRQDLAKRVTLDGVAQSDIADKLRQPLKALIDAGKVTTEGEKRLMVYVTAASAKKVLSAGEKVPINPTTAVPKPSKVAPAGAKITALPGAKR